MSVLGEMDDWRIAMKPVLPVCLDVKTIFISIFLLKKKKIGWEKTGMLLRVISGLFRGDNTPVLLLV